MDGCKENRAASPLLVVKALCKHYEPVEALSAAAFSLYGGEILGLIGPNGSGKTTLLECLCGLQPADRREVWWKGSPLGPARCRAVLFYVPEATVPYPEHTVNEVLAFLGGAYRLPGRAVRDVADALSLGPMLTRRAGQLSKGWRRRLLLALGLLAPQPVLVFDEPFDGLDLRQTRDVLNLLRGVAAEGRTLLLSIHQLTDAERACDRVVLLSSGKVAGEGTLDELRALAGSPHGTLEDIYLALA